MIRKSAEIKKVRDVTIKALEAVLMQDENPGDQYVKQPIIGMLKNNIQLLDWVLGKEFQKDGLKIS